MDLTCVERPHGACWRGRSVRVDFRGVEQTGLRRVLRELRVSFSMVAAGLLWAASVQAGYSPTNHPFSGIAVYSETRTDPPNRLFVAEVDLAQPGLEMRVARGGPDPDGPGPWQTTLLQPTRIAAREQFDLVINGDFFKVRSAADGETNGPGYRPAVWSRVNGPAASQCEVWSTNTAAQPSLVARRDGRLEIRLVAEPGAKDCELIAGNTLLVKDGRVVAPPSKVRHPRTVVGLNAQGTTLVILVVDGRKPGIAQGMSYLELAAEMLRLGCDDALNLDGGGSSLLAIRDPATGNYQIVNEPTDGRERPVANALGVVVPSDSGPSAEPRQP